MEKLDKKIQNEDFRQRIYLALESGSDGVWDWDLESHTCYVSPRWCELLGFDEEFCYRDISFWRELIHPKDLRQLRLRLKRHILGASSHYEAEARVKSREGSWIWVSHRGKVVGRDKNGKAKRIVGTQVDITRQKLAEADLAEKDRRWENLMAIAPVGIYQTDARGHFFYVNQAWCKLTGVSEKMAIGKPWMDVLPPEDRTRVSEEWHASVNGKHPFVSHYRYRNPSGEDRWVLGNAVEMRDSLGGITGYLGTVQDIGSLHTAHVRLQNFLENIPAGAVYIENEKMILNRACEQIIGYSRQEIKNVDDWFERLQKEQPQKHRAIYEQLKKEGFLSKPIIPITRKDGEVRHIEFSGVKEDSFEVWHLNDMTERLLAEEKFRVLFERSTDAHLLLDESGITDCNMAAVSMLGFAHKKQLIGKNPILFSPDFQPDGQESVMKLKEMDAIAHSKGVHRFEWIYRKVDGTEFPVEVVLSPVTINAKPVLLVIWHDLTEQKNIQAQIAQSSKMASLGEMAGGLAHEINNPLTIIKVKAEQISLRLERERQVDSAWLMEKVAIVDQTVERIAKIIKGLKNFARDSGSELAEPAEIKSILEDTLSFCSARFKSFEVALTVIQPSDPIVLNCRPIQLSQVFLNLLNNAFDAVQDSDQKWIRLEVKKSENSVDISFSDSGPGVPESIRSKIMQPFFTTKEIGKGTGLGLSISRGIVESHEGKLFLETGRGATKFVVSLPLVAGLPKRKKKSNESFA